MQDATPTARYLRLPVGAVHRDIRSFIDQLRREKEIVEISAEVDCDLELAEIHRRVIAADGPALLFTNPKGYDIPVVTNLFGTKEDRKH